MYKIHVVGAPFAWKRSIAVGSFFFALLFAPGILVRSTQADTSVATGASTKKPLPNAGKTKDVLTSQPDPLPFKLKGTLILKHTDSYPLARGEVKKVISLFFSLNKREMARFKEMRSSRRARVAEVVPRSKIQKVTACISGCPDGYLSQWGAELNTGAKLVIGKRYFFYPITQQSDGTIAVAAVTEEKEDVLIAGRVEGDLQRMRVRVLGEPESFKFTLVTSGTGERLTIVVRPEVTDVDPIDAISAGNQIAVTASLSKLHTFVADAITLVKKGTARPTATKASSKPTKKPGATKAPIAKVPTKAPTKPGSLTPTAVPTRVGPIATATPQPTIVQQPSPTIESSATPTLTYTSTATATPTQTPNFPEASLFTSLEAAPGSGASGQITAIFNKQQKTLTLQTRYDSLSGPGTVAEIKGGGVILLDLRAPMQGSKVLGITADLADKLSEAIANKTLSYHLTTASYPHGELSGTFVAMVGSFDEPAPPPPVTPVPNMDRPSRMEAARFLRQATFGATVEEINKVMQMGFEAYLDEQLNMPRDPNLWFNRLIELGRTQPVYGQAVQGNFIFDGVNSRTQVLDRVALALSEFFVISGATNDTIFLSYHANAALGDHFHNLNRTFRQHLYDISTNGLMGIYLSSSGNSGDESKGQKPDENYAREVMQLFSMGLPKLWQNGTMVLDTSGNIVPNYVQKDVEGLAKVFTGWSSLQTRETDLRYYKMAFDPSAHSKLDKSFLGITIPGNTPGEQALDIALDRIANSPSVAPFVARYFIQRFVTSNPTPDYIWRVAAAFNNNGSGVRGDLKAVIKAVLLDPEARGSVASARPSFGKITEPLVRFVGLLRIFKFSAPDGGSGWAEYPDFTVGQRLFGAPSVFGYHNPRYSPEGVLSQAALVSPDDTLLPAWCLRYPSQMYHDFLGSNGNVRTDIYAGKFTDELAAFRDKGLEGLLDHLELVVLGRQMSPELRQMMIKRYNDIPNKSDSFRVVNTLIALLVFSPEGYLLK